MTTPTRRLRALLAMSAAAVLLAACGEATPAATGTSAAPSEPSPAPASTSPDAPAPDAASTPTATETARSAAFDHPVLTSVATMADGSTFTVADFAGRTIFVETFATWCSNCRRQLGDTNQAAAQAGDDAVFLILSIENNLDPAELEPYAAENGFDQLTFGVLDEQGLAAFNEQFGRSVLNAPSTPKFIVQPDGAIGELHTGYESPDEILAQLA